MFYKHGQADLEEHIRQEEAAMSVRTKARQQGISGWMGLVRTVRDCKTQVRVVCALCEGMHGMCPSRNAGAWREVWLLEYCVGMEGSVSLWIMRGQGGKCVSWRSTPRLRSRAYPDRSFSPVSPCCQGPSADHPTDSVIDSGREYPRFPLGNMHQIPEN